MSIVRNSECLGEAPGVTFQEAFLFACEATDPIFYINLNKVSTNCKLGAPYKAYEIDYTRHMRGGALNSQEKAQGRLFRPCNSCGCKASSRQTQERSWSAEPPTTKLLYK